MSSHNQSSSDDVAVGAFPTSLHNNNNKEYYRRPLDPESMERGPRLFAGLPDSFRNHIVSMIGEFVGTFMFLLGAFVIAQAANSDTRLSKDGSNPNQIVMIAFGFGFTVMVNVFVFFRISGGQLNPAVSLTLLLVRAIGPVRFVVNVVAQLVAGIAAAAATNAMTPGPILFANTLGGGCSRTQGLFLEMFATSLLTMSVVFMAVEKHRGTFMAPLVIGVALFVGHLMTIYYTGASLNPARTLGPAVAMRSFPNYAWIYHLGPFMASIFTAGLWYLLTGLKYETANPGQDASRKDQ